MNRTTIPDLLVIFCLGILAACSYLSLALDQMPSSLYLVGALGLSWLCYLCSVVLVMRQQEPWSWTGLIVIFGFAIGYRIIMFWLPAIDATDFERYLFDGRALANGLNSYAITPQDYPGLQGDIIPKPEIKTIYPPVAEALFLMAHYLGGSLLSLRFMALIPDVGCIIILYGLIKKRGLPVGWLLIYLWNPLLLKEAFNSAHIDVWVMFTLLLFYYLLMHHQRILALLALASATLIKLVPGVLLIPWLLSLSSQSEKIKLGVLFGSVLLAAFLIFFPATPFMSLLLFFSHIEGKGILFQGLSAFFSPENARMIITVVGGLFMLQFVLFSRTYRLSDDQPLFMRTLEILLLAFIFSTMGFPWYLLIVVPFLTLQWKPYLMVFIAMSHITYYADNEVIIVLSTLLSFGFICYSIFIKKEWLIWPPG